MTLQDLIRTYRASTGLSQRQFAEKCGLSGSYIANIEVGRTSHGKKAPIPSVLALSKIAKGMTMTLEELFETCGDIACTLSETDSLPGADAPGYERLNEKNRQTIDYLIEQLLKSQ